MAASFKYCGLLITAAFLVACNSSQPKDDPVKAAETTMALQQPGSVDTSSPVIEQPKKPLPTIPAPKDTNAGVIRDTIPVDTLPPAIDSLPVRKVGELILNERIIATDNPVTMHLMDSLNASTRKERQFYFRVFDKMMGRADGSLSEAIGHHAKAFVEKRTKEFFDFTDSYDKTRMETWASQLGIEIFLSAENARNEYARTAQLLKDNCSSCDAKTLKRLDDFNAMILRTIKENEVKK